MHKKESTSIKILYSLSREILHENYEGKMYELRRMVRTEDEEVYDLRKKQSALAAILAKTQRMDSDD